MALTHPYHLSLHAGKCNGSHQHLIDSQDMQNQAVRFIRNYYLGTWMIAAITLWSARDAEVKLKLLKIKYTLHRVSW